MLADPAGTLAKFLPFWSGREIGTYAIDPVGVGWSQQRLGITIPADDWDVPLDGFASQDGLEWFS